MNADLVDSRKKANALYSTQDCPRKESGQKIGIMELTKRLWDAKGYAELNKSSQNLRDQYAKIMNAVSQPESQFLNNELGNQTMPTTTERSGTIDGNENTTTTEQSYNEPSEEYITMANNAKKWYEITSQVKERDCSERTSSSFCKNVPNNKDIKELRNIASNLITLDPKEHPRDYLWQCNCAIYSVAAAWKKGTEKRKSRQNEGKKTQEYQPKWLRQIESKIRDLRKEISQITEEIRRIRKNGKLTTKMRKNRRWMRRQMKANITIARLTQLKERKLNQLRLKKQEKDKKQKASERHQANKQFDEHESQFYERCRNIIRSHPDNTRPLYKKLNHTASQQHNNLATQDFEQFWRPIWETAASENLESKWIKEIRSILQSHGPAQSTESVVITAELYYNSIKKTKNWSSPGTDKITNFWIKNIEFHMEKKPENNANKVDIAVMDKEKKVWLLIEGTVCGIGLISDRWKTKQDKYTELRTGIKQQYPDYKVNQVNVVFDFLAEYHQSLKNDLNEHLAGKNEEETQYLIMNSQKWIISQNVEIVKNFYTYKR